LTRRGRHLKRRLALLGLRYRVVKIHGPQRAGTNFVARVMKVNAPRVLVPWPDEGGWKHGPFEPHRRWSYLVVARHPLAWAESLHDWEVKHGRSSAATLTDFLREPSLDPRLEEVWGTRRPFDVYAASYASWLDSRLPTTVVRYEDLVEDLDRAVRGVLAQLELPCPTTVAGVPDRADVWTTTIERRPLDRERSLHGWRDVTSEADRTLARRGIPPSLLDRLGYTL
jgi:hypothetical protein